MSVHSNTAENTDERLPEGTIIDGRYEIIGHLGRGGFAHVYKARHIHLEREIALKILEFPSGPGTQQFQARFLQEARIAAKIKHPNVVDVFDFGVANELGQPYLAMDYLAGHDLEEELVRNGPMEPQRAVGLFIDTMSALGDGHLMGIVHKDLKPSNLYLRDPGTKDERLIILDFGIARVFGDKSSQMTQTGSFSGTPAYLAPEYIENQIVTPALDVYQMGLILIETLTAIPAVMAGNSMAYLLAHCQGQVRMPEELRRTGLGEILIKATQLDPKKRYANATEFCDALGQVEVPSLPFVGSRTMPLGFGNRGRMDSINVLGETSENTPTLPYESAVVSVPFSSVPRASVAPTVDTPATVRNSRLGLVFGGLVVFVLLGFGTVVGLHLSSMPAASTESGDSGESGESAAGSLERAEIPVGEIPVEEPVVAVVVEARDVGVDSPQAPVEVAEPVKNVEVKVVKTRVKSRVDERPATVKTVKPPDKPEETDQSAPLVAP